MLLAYSKMSLDRELLQSDLPDAPELVAELLTYFPSALRERFPAQIATHPLHREITATLLTNDLINRAGITFINELQTRSGRPAPEIARAYRIVREAFALPPLWAEIEALDNKVAATLQSEMLLDIAGVVEHAAAWLLRSERLGMAAETSRFTPAVAGLAANLADLLPASERAVMVSRGERLAAAGVPPPLTARIAAVIFLTTAFEIGDLAGRAGQPVERAARTFYGVGASFALDELRAAARRLPTNTLWQKAAVETLIDDSYALQAEVAERMLQSAGGAEAPIVAWTTVHAAALAPVEGLARELRTAANPDLAMLFVVSRQLRQALG